MDFYHPEDMPLLKEVYEAITKNSHIKRMSVTSRPYRFLTKNGCYITVETEFEGFVHPWSRKLEVVRGTHKVLQGKTNISPV